METGKLLTTYITAAGDSEHLRDFCKFAFLTFTWFTKQPNFTDKLGESLGDCLGAQAPKISSAELDSGANGITQSQHRVWDFQSRME